MDLLGRESRVMLDAALAELSSLRAAVELERTNRRAAESLAESYRIRAEHAEELAHKLEDERAEAVRERIASLESTVSKLTAAAVPKDNPNDLAAVKERMKDMKELPRPPGINPLRKAMIDGDMRLMQYLEGERNKRIKEAMNPPAQEPPVESKPN